MMNWRNAENGTYANQPTYCTVNCGPKDCPYADINRICHTPNPIKDCEEFAMFFESWDDWLALGDEDYEVGYDPFSGCFTDDC